MGWERRSQCEQGCRSASSGGCGNTTSPGDQRGRGREGYTLALPRNPCYLLGNSHVFSVVHLPRNMNIYFKDRKMKAAFEDEGLCRKTYGVEMAKKIGQRMVQLMAAETLADFWPPNSGPERCHKLTANLAGTFSMNLKQPYRLLFVPLDLPPGPVPENEQDLWQMVRSIEIVGIEDTHG